MSVYVITYDLLAPEQDYKSLFEVIESLGSYSKNFDSFWLIDSQLSAAEIRDKIKPVLDSDDRLLVIKTRQSWASYNTRETGPSEWLKSDERDWN